MIKNSLVVVLLLVLTGCMVQQKYWGKVSPIFMDEKARSLIKSTKVLVGLDHDSRMGPPVLERENPGGQYGIIGSLNESTMAHSESKSTQERQKNLDGINKAAIDFNIGSRFREAIEESIKPFSWLNVTYVVKKHDVKIPEIEQMVKTLDEDALLLIDNKYLMAKDFSNITVFSYVALYANEKNLVKIAKDARPYEDPPTLYKNLFQYEFRYDGTYTTADSALKGWNENDGEMLKRALTKSIADLNRQIVADFSSTTIEFPNVSK